MTNVVTKFEKVDRFLKFKVQEWTESALMKTSIYAYDLADKAFYKNGSPCVLDTFKRGFYNLSFIKDIAPLCSSPDYHRYMTYVLCQLASNVTNVGTILDKLSQYSYLEKYFSAGLMINYSFFSMCESNLLDYIAKPILNYLREHKIPVESSFLVFFNHKQFANKFLLEVLKQGSTPKKFKEFISLLYSRTINKKFNYTTKLYDESYSEIQKIIDAHGLNLAKYVEYLVYISEHETGSISIAYNAHRDYLKMMNQLIENRAYKKFKKYPYYLTSIHDITAINRNLNDPKKYNLEKFKEAILPVKERLTFHDKNYAIVFPETPMDIISESQALAHCASSYIASVIEDGEIICFIRSGFDKDESLLTMHITGGNTIFHVRGFGNRLPSQTEKMFIAAFGTAKQLIINKDL